MKGMKFFTKPLAILIVMVLIMSTAVCAASAEDASLAAAEGLRSIGLFLGRGDDALGNPNFDLDSESNRMEGLIMFLRFIGEYDVARTSDYSSPFTDVTGEYDRAIVAYAFQMGHTKGVSDTEFDPHSTMTATQFLTFTLRALGYSEEDGDFRWDSAWEKTDQLGITQGQFDDWNNSLLRGDIAIVTVFALEQPFKDSEQTLLGALIDDGVFQRLAEQGLIVDENILVIIQAGVMDSIVDFVNILTETVIYEIASQTESNDGQAQQPTGGGGGADSGSGDSGGSGDGGGSGNTGSGGPTQQQIAAARAQLTEEIDAKLSALTAGTGMSISAGLDPNQDGQGNISVSGAGASTLQGFIGSGVMALITNTDFSFSSVAIGGDLPNIPDLPTTGSVTAWISFLNTLNPNTPISEANGMTITFNFTHNGTATTMTYTINVG